MLNITYSIPTTQGRRFVIADIHGCFQPLQSLIQEQINLQKTDQIFLLGDYIDRGYFSKKTLDYIIDLQNQNYKVYPLRGNHEQELLNAVNKIDKRYIFKHLSHFNSLDLYRPDNELGISRTHFNFLNHLPYYFDLGDFYLVHAGFNFNCPNYLKDDNAMLWTRQMTKLPNHLKGKKVVIGHTPTPLWYIKRSIKRQEDIINLDNGCVFAGIREDLGNLLALNLDNFQLFESPNRA